MNGTLKVAVRVLPPKVGEEVIAFVFPELPWRFKVVSVNEKERTAHVHRIY